jgi:hypothetical protein
MHLMRRLLPVVLLLSFTSCGTPDPVGPAPSLSAPEARALLVALSGVSSLDYRFLLEPPAPIEGQAHATVDTFTDSIPCPAGGMAIVTGFMDFEESGEVDIVLRDDFRNCMVEDEDGRIWRFDAAPFLRAHLQMLAPEGDVLVFVGSVVGAVRFTSDDASGVCSFDVLLATPDDLEATGTVCGHALQTLRDADA